MLYPLANLANLLMWGLVILGGTWCYTKYRFEKHFVGKYFQKLIFSGELAHVGVGIEECTGKVWDMIFQPMLNKVSPHFLIHLFKRLLGTYFWNLNLRYTPGVVSLWSCITRRARL